MKLQPGTERELLVFAGSEALRRDMETLRTRWRNPFVINGRVDIDGFLEFLTEFNEFINHEPKPFKPMLDWDMKL
ncbi:MAG: hypothetical protein HZB33_05765 [Nitrospirae bacterium]|nr:hypothetical protein [Nitrospirota bacterium]